MDNRGGLTVVGHFQGCKHATMKPASFSILITLLLITLVACSPSDSDDSPDNSSGEALLDVAEQGNLDALNALLVRHRPDVRDSCDWTPLMKAALYGHTPVVARLLDAGASIDAVDKGGYTAMMLAASNNHAATVELLIERGAMIDHREDTEGLTALIWAAKQGHAKTVETLLRHRADRTLKDFGGRTAADWAATGGYAEVQRLLASPSDHPSPI